MGNSMIIDKIGCSIVEFVICILSQFLRFCAEPFFSLLMATSSNILYIRNAHCKNFFEKITNGCSCVLSLDISFHLGYKLQILFA